MSAAKPALSTVPKGVMHVPVTPFNTDMSVDYDTFEKLVDWHVRQNPSSLCVVLHIAESVSLTMEEHKKLIEISVKVTNGRVPVIANVSMAGTDANNWRHGRKNKGVSYSTEDNRASTLWLMFHQLHRKLNMPMMPRSFKSRHVKPLVRLWEHDGLSAATMQTRLSYLKTFSTWIGKAGMISGTLADYLGNPELAKRTYAAQRDKSWSAKGIDVGAIIAKFTAYDQYIGAQLTLEWRLALRAKESCMCRPHESDQGDYFVVKHGTKGGRERRILIDTPEKRAAVDLARSLVDHPSQFLGDPNKSLKQNLARHRNTLARFGVTKAKLGVTGHGLRAGYGLDLYQTLTGVAPPIRGGEAIPSATDRAARLRIAEDFGHGRPSISTAYIGAVLPQRIHQAATNVDTHTEAGHAGC